MERQKTLVVDASVMVKWFINEENSDKAFGLKDSLIKKEVALIAPDLIISEVLNTLRYKKRNENELLHANKNLWGLNLGLMGINNEIMLKAIENSIKYDITIYDSLYVTIAQLHGIALITADKKLYRIPNVIALEKI